MASFNKVILLGNVTRDPQLKHLPGGSVVVEFGMAVNRKYKTAGGEAKEEVCFVDLTAFGKPAEMINQYCQKGKPLFVEGRLKLDSWTDKDQKKRSKISIVVENFQLLGGRSEGSGPSEPAAGQYGGKSDKPTNPIGEEEKFTPEDIPF